MYLTINSELEILIAKLPNALKHYSSTSIISDLEYSQKILIKCSITSISPNYSLILSFLYAILLYNKQIAEAFSGFEILPSYNLGMTSRISSAFSLLLKTKLANALVLDAPTSGSPILFTSNG